MELVVNGEVVESQLVPADGQVHDLSWDVAIETSSWVALRQFPQLHTNPVTPNPIKIASQVRMTGP